MMDKRKYFGETFYYRPGEMEKIKAKQWLIDWKENLLRKLHRDSFHCEVIDEQWVERDASIVSSLALWESIGLKICVQAKWNYEL